MSALRATFQRLLHATAGLLAVAAATALSAAPRINEVVFQGGAPQPENEWIEIYNPDGGAVVMTGYTLSNQGAFSYTFPTFTLGAGAYVVVHLGTGIDTGSNLYVGAVTEQLDNAGDDLVLTTAGSSVIDYIAWGSGGAIDPPPVGPSWTGAVSIAGLGTDDSIAYLASGTDPDDPAQWIVRSGANVTAAGANTEQTAPTVSYTTTTVSASDCEVFTVDLAVGYTDEAALGAATLTLQIPAGIYVVATDGGTYNGTQISWSLGALAAGTTFSPQFVAECDAGTAVFAGADLDLTFTRYAGGASSSVDAGIDQVTGTFLAPSVTVEISEFTTGDETIFTEDGQFVEFRVTVANAGPGALVNGTNLTLGLGNNLNLISLKNNNAGGTSVAFTQTGQDVFFTSPVLLSGESHDYFVRAQVADCTQLTTTISSSYGCSDLAPGVGTCSQDTSDVVEVYCLLEMAIVNTLPSPGYAASGEVISVAITLTNHNDVAIPDGELTLTLPDDFYFFSVTPGSVANYTSGTRTVVLPAGVLGVIPAGGTSVVTLEVTPSCEAISDQNIVASLNYASGAETLIANSPDIPVRLPQINILFEDASNPGSTTVLAERGETVTFLLTALNSGTGELNDGADLSTTLGAGFANVQIREGAAFPGGSVVSGITVSGTTYSWNSGAIAGTSSKLYYITATVDSCENLNNSADFSWGVAGPVPGEECSTTNVSSSSVTIELAEPALSATYPALPIDYCGGGSITIPLENTGTGQARNVTLVLTGIPDSQFVISNPVNVSFTHVGNVVTLTLTGGSDTDFDSVTDDIAGGATVNVGFDIDVLGGGVACDVGGGSIRYQPGFQDSCDYIYNTGTAFGSYSVSNQPSVAVTITGPGSANVGQTGLTYTVTATYTGPASTSVTFDLVADYPDAADTLSGFGNFVATAASDAGVINGDTATWAGLTLTTPASPAFSTVTLTRTITVDAPTATCAGGNFYDFAVELAGAATDCNGCSLIPPGGLTGNSNLYINNNNDFTLAVIDHARSVEYLNVNSNGRDLSAITTEGESCTELTFTSTITFNPGNGITDWALPYVGSAGPMRFIDDANDAIDLLIPGSGGAYKSRLALLVTYDGIDVTANIADSDITEAGDGTFQIDLSGLNALVARPDDGKILEFTYTLESNDASSSSVSFSQLLIPNNDADPCGNNFPEEYDQGVGVTVSSSQLNVGVSKITGSSQLIDKCETATFRLSLSASQGWSVYDGRVVVELGGNYAYETGTTVIAGLLDENGVAIPTAEPVIVGTTLSWDLGDLNDAAGTIEFQATKLCGTTATTLSATATSNTNCTNQADASVSSRSNTDSGSYAANTLASGNMAVVLAPETYYAKDGYPVIRFYVINSGNGKLFNAVVPIALDAGLEFFSAEFPGGAAVVPSSGTLGDQNVEFTFPEIAPGQIVAVEMTLRFDGCADLGVAIVNARWGCEGDFCQSGLADSSVIEQAESKIFVVSHTATPDTLDYCGGTAIFSVVVRNNGVVEAYEPVIREFLPDGLTIVGNPQYRLNGGPWNNFPGLYTSNSKAAMGDPSSGPVGGDWYYWNFTDPNNDNSESDSLLTSTDGHEGDGDGRRHFVLKPGDEIDLQFEVEIQNCTDALDYYNSSKTARAAIFYDLPCAHNSSGFPQSSSSLNSILRPPGRAEVDLQILAQNTTKATPANNNLVRGEVGDTVEITLTLEAIDRGQAPNVSVSMPLPANLGFQSITLAGGSTGGVSFTNAATPAIGTSGTVSFDVDNSNIDALDTTYLRPADQLIVTITGTVLSCDSDSTVAATAVFGCCDGAGLGSPSVPGASGSVTAAVDLQSRPDVPTVDIIEATAFDACTGALTVTLVNGNPDFTLFDFDVVLTLPSGWVYDDSTASAGTAFAYTGAPGARTGNELTQPEEEPSTLVAGELRWASTAFLGAGIAPARAKLFPGETVEITVFLRNNNCPDNSTNSNTTDFPDRADNDTSNPDISLANVTASVALSYQDSCQAGAYDPILDSVSINPDQPDLDILSITPSITFIGSSTMSIVWTVQVRNTSSEKAADNILFSLDFGAGYSGVVRQSGTVQTTNTNGTRTFTWDDAFTVATATTTTWTFEATIDTVTRGDLSVTANLDGRCYNLNGDFFCNYSDDYLKTYVTGASITKVTDGTELVLPAVSTPGANNATATTANLTIGSIVRNVITVEVYEGGATDIALTDTLPDGFTFLQANARLGAGAWTTVTNSGSGTSVVLANQAPFDNISGGAVIGAVTALEVEIWSQVNDDTVLNLIGATKTNTAEVTVTRGSYIVSHDNPSGVDLQDTNTFTIIEPRLTGPTKDSLPVSGTSGTPHVVDLAVDPNTIDYTVTVTNTGTSTAYETIFTDAVPFGMEVAAATVTITRGGTAPVDALVLATDYTFAFTPGVTGAPGLLTLTFLDTTLAEVRPTDVVTITYTGSITGAAPGQQLFNAATFSGYSSLPDDGATKTTATGGTFNESTRERTSYGSTFLAPTAVRTYHILFGELEATKVVANEITPPSGGGTATDFRDLNLTRVTIGERVIYQARLKIPPFLTVYNPRIEDTVPDGLTVRAIAWEVVAPDAALTDGATIVTPNITIPTQASGTTPIAHDTGSSGGVNVALPASITGTATGKDLLVQIEATLDQALNGGTAIAAQSFNNVATFRWASFPAGPRDYNVSTTAVSFTAVVPAIADGSVTKTLVAHQDATFTPVTPTTATGTSRFGEGLTGAQANTRVVRPGDLLQYKLTFINSGTATAYDVVLQDALPALTSINFATAAPNGYTYFTDGTHLPEITVSGGTTVFSAAPALTDNLIEMTLDQVAVGATVEVTYWLQVQNDLSANAFFQTRSDITDYRSLPTTTAFGAVANVPRTMSSTPVAFAAINYDYAGVVTPVPVITQAFASDITPPTPDTFLTDDTGRATIGEEITYRMTVDLEDNLALYDFNLRTTGTSTYITVPSGLTVRHAAYTLGTAAEVVLAIPAKQSNGTTRISLPAAIDIVDSVVTGDPEFTLLVYATLDTANLAASFSGVNDNDSNGRLSFGDRISITPTFAWNQWNDVSPQTKNVSTSTTRRFFVREPVLSALAKTLTTGATSGTGNDYNNFYGEGPNTPAATVDNVPLFAPGDTLSYTISFTSQAEGANGATAYNVVLVDRIPQGLTYVGGSVAEDSPTGTLTPTVTGPSVLDPTHMAQDLEFAFDQIGPGETVTVTYDVTVDDPVAAGRYLQNRVDLADYSSLPTGYTGVDTHAGVVESNERDTDSANPYADLGPRFAFAGVEVPTVFGKTIETELTAPGGQLSDGSSRATIGERVTYELTIDIADGHALYDFYLYDQIPDGMTILPGQISYTLNGSSGLTAGLLHDGNRQVGLALGDVIGTAAADELVLVIPATVDRQLDSSGSVALDAGDVLANGFTFSWNQVDIDPDPTVNLSTDARTTVNSSTVTPVALTLREPDLDATLTKLQANVREGGAIGDAANSRGTNTYYAFAAGGGPDGVNVTTHADVEVTLPDDRIVYTVTVQNTGDAPAFDVSLRDILPADDAVDYLSGTGTETVGGGTTGTWSGSFNGSTGSRLTIGSSSTVIGGETRTQLDFTVDFLSAGDTATIDYLIDIDRDIGAGRYLGVNEVRLVDYGSLPDAALGVTVGNLAAGNTVEDNSLERDSDSAVDGDPAPYTDQGPISRKLGVDYPLFAKTVTRLYDDEGFYNPAVVSPNEIVRVGELLKTSLAVTLPRYTRLLDGGVAAAVMRDVLPAGQTYTAETVEAVVYPNYDTTALDLSAFTPVVSTSAAAGVQTVSLSFADIINATGADITGTVEFLSEIKPLAADGSNLLADTTAQLSGFNQAHLFWNTHDSQAQRVNNVASGSLTPSTDDVPWLGQTGPVVLTRQPNLSLAKTASVADGSIVGATAAVGDPVTYTLTISNAAPTSFSGIAYDVAVSDTLPRNIAPLTLTDLTSATAGGRPLVKDEDYTFSYTYDNTTRRGAIAFATQRDVGNADYASRLEPSEDLVLTYALTVNPNIGAEGSGVGLMANRAQVDEHTSFPAALNDPDRQTYAAVGPASHTLVTPTPLVTKTSVNANASLTVGDVVTYTITAPASLLRANLYQVEIRDVLPAGLSFGGTGTSGPAAAGTVTLDVGGSSAVGNDVTVEGGSGNVTITVSDDRTVSVLVDLIANDEGTAATLDQVTVTLQAVVQSTFPGGAPIPRLHAFENYAELYWFNADEADVNFTGRNRFLVLSEKVTHYFEAFGILLEPDNQGTGVPGEIKTYRHTLRNFQSVAADVPLVWSSTLGWTWVAYIGDGNGNVVSGPFSSGSTFAVVADGATEIIMQAFVPAPATAFTTDVLTITGYGPPDFDAAVVGGDQDLSVFDTTVVQAPGVVIRKDISDDNGSSYDTRLLVDPTNPNHVIQRLRFFNNSMEAVKNVYVYDFIPDHTAYVAGTAVNTATYALSYSTDGGQTWLVGEPGGAADAVTNLRWYYNSGAALPPADEHTITFKLRVK